LEETVIEPSQLMEEELANTVAKVKGKNSKGKNKQGKNKNKNKSSNSVVSYPVKKSILNEEFPGQSDNFNGVDIGSKKKDPAATTPSSALGQQQHSKTGGVNIGHGSSSSFQRALIDRKLANDAETGLGPEGVVDESILQPKIFSSFYNTPDSFRLGVEVSNKQEIDIDYRNREYYSINSLLS
jgi:hypothetical protein